ncbi:MAG: hypothetical protein M1488_03655 [Gammaproteobacteria bacterium]|nr:hypothetical protein [Gammaproteobacteria bacterium]
MAYERMLFADAVCFLGAAVAVNGFKPLLQYGEGGTPFAPSYDDIERQLHIEAYLRRCIRLGTLPVRRWPLYGIEPAPLAPVDGGVTTLEDPGLMVSIADFREWIKRSQVQAPESWADALSDSIQWDDQPIPGTQIVTGEPKVGRPRKLGDNAQAEANKIALELYNSNGKMPTQKAISTKLGTKYGAAWSTAKDRFRVKLCKEYIKTLKQ